ncbi:MAG: radical SAM family heme chaperone HemW [Planctomycetota bacterium]
MNITRETFISAFNPESDPAPHKPDANPPGQAEQESRRATLDPGDSSATLPTPLPAPAGAVFDALYLHLPFCTHKCGYCDFYSVVIDKPGDHQARFTAALVDLIDACDRAYRVRPTTLFIGGGTPTHLEPNHWRTLLTALHDRGWLDALVEWTVEANPESTTPELIQTLAHAGLNRVSIGVQSFDPGGLAVLDRRHNPHHVRRAVDACRNAGIDNLSLDLIFAYPGQSVARLQQDLDAALALEPEHMSVYGLTFEPDTAITRRLHAGQIQRAPESLEKDLYQALLDRLAKEGFAQYEISNFARTRPGLDRRCQHNLAYWTNQNWLGLGPAAGSHHRGVRWRIAPDFQAFIKNPAAPRLEDVEHLTAEQQIGDAFLLGLRLNQGLPVDRLPQLAPSGSARDLEIKQLVDLGLLEAHQGALRMTPAGRFVGDSIVARLL